MRQLDDLAEAAEDLRRLGVDAWHQFMYGPHGGLEGLDVDEVFFPLLELCLPENREAFLRADFLAIKARRGPEWSLTEPRCVHHAG